MTRPEEIMWDDTMVRQLPRYRPHTLPPQPSPDDPSFARIDVGKVVERTQQAKLMAGEQ